MCSHAQHTMMGIRLSNIMRPTSTCTGVLVVPSAPALPAFTVFYEVGVAQIGVTTGKFLPWASQLSFCPVYPQRIDKGASTSCFSSIERGALCWSLHVQAPTENWTRKFGLLRTYFNHRRQPSSTRAAYGGSIF